MIDRTSNRLDRVVDRLVGLVNPRKAALRAWFRAIERDPDFRELVAVGMRARGYRAAKSGGSSTPFVGGTKSADGEISGDLPSLRNRSRELNRDDPLASGLTRTFVDEVIGTGLWPKPRVRLADGKLDTKKNAAIEKVFWRLSENLYRGDRLTYGAAQRMRFRKVLEDGEVFRRSYKADGSTPLWFEIVEADRVATPGDKSGSANIRDGIERDAAGVPVAVWIAKAHPGDTLVGAVQRADFERIEFPNVQQIGVKERPGQTRCVPAFHAILQDLRDLDLLILASLKRVQIAACLALFIKTNKSVPDLWEVTAEQYGYKLDQAIEPGMIFKLFPEEEVQTLVPNMDLPELSPFIVMLARRIGAALGVSWQVVLRDFSDSTYSSARTDKLDAYKTYDVWQFLFVEMDLVPEYRDAMTDAVLRREPELVAADVTVADCFEVQHVPNGRSWIDPVKEANAKLIELNNLGTTSRTEICASQGKDYPTVLAQRLEDEALENTMRTQMNLPAPVAKPTPPALPPPPPDEPEEKPRRGIFSLLSKTG